MHLRVLPVTFLTLLVVTVATGCPKSTGGSGHTASKKGALAFDLKSTNNGEPLAKIGDTTLSVSDVQDRLNKQSPFVRARYQSPEKLREFVDNQVRFEVLAIEAHRKGIHLDAEVQDALKKIMVQKLTRDEFDGRVRLADITDAELQTYYDAHADEYNKPEMIRASVLKIGFGPDDASKKAAAVAAAAAQKKASDPATIADRNHFKEVVVAAGTDEELKRTGGDVRYLSQSELETKFGPAVKDAAWALSEVNDVSPVVTGPDAFYVVKKTGVRKPIVRSFEQVKNQIRNLIFREKRNDAFNAYVEELKKGLGVEFYDDKLKAVSIDASGITPEMANADAHGDGHDHGDMDVHGGAPGAGDVK